MELSFLIPIMGIIMGVSIPITALKLKHKEKIEQMRLAATASGDRDSGRSARHDARIEELEDRVRVLERIVTDGGYNVATQIEALRDTRAEERDAGMPLGLAQKEKA
jgi:hypothetical protein